jgi:hypothetical protein
VINSTPLHRKDNPRWPIGNAQETIKVPSMPAPLGRAQAQRQAATPTIGMATGMAAAGDAIRRAASIVAAWLIGLPRRAGRRLFAMNDLEARWRGWQVIELSGGLRRQYRDLRFISAVPGERPPRPPVPPVPEAWDDHWDGRSLGSGTDAPPGCPLDGDD